jgi:SpoVK/Ycf46/Vps4 family AAA+-type ATPase
MRKAIRVAESVAPCILWLDELEKGLSGTQSSGSTDGGTTARVFSTFLTWLQEKTVPVFVVSTANNVEALPPELLRKGRFDEIFFIDLPSREERTEIFKIHIRKRKRDPEKYDSGVLAEATPGFSGAEIEQLVVEALFDAFDEGRDVTMEDLLKAARSTVPLSMTMREKIAYLRDWAETRARKASSEPAESIEEQTAAFLMARAQEESFRQAAAAQAPKTAKPKRASAKKTDGAG